MIAQSIRRLIRPAPLAALLLGLPLAAAAQPMPNDPAGPPKAPTLNSMNSPPPPTGPERIPLDTEVKVAGIQVGCTGVGQSKDDAHWRGYSARLEFSRPGGDLLADETIVLSNKRGRTILTAACQGPWIMLGLRPGAYSVVAHIRSAEMHRSATFIVPRRGQARVEIEFPSP